MPFLVKIIVFTNNDPDFANRVGEVISKSGGKIRESECKKTSSEDYEVFVSFLIERPEVLPGIVGAVERIRGVGVMAVTEPVSSPDTRPA